MHCVATANEKFVFLVKQKIDRCRVEHYDILVLLLYMYSPNRLYARREHKEIFTTTNI